MRHTFRVVSLTGRKSGLCGCGKRRKRAKRFFQTINPFNKNKLGLPKSELEIIYELRTTVERWERLAITCRNCEVALPSKPAPKERKR